MEELINLIAELTVVDALERCCDQRRAAQDDETILRALEGFIEDVIEEDRTKDGINNAV